MSKSGVYQRRTTDKFNRSIAALETLICARKEEKRSRIATLQDVLEILTGEKAALKRGMGGRERTKAILDKLKEYVVDNKMGNGLGRTMRNVEVLKVIHDHLSSKLRPMNTATSSGSSTPSLPSIGTSSPFASLGNPVGTRGVNSFVTLPHIFPPQFTPMFLSPSQFFAVPQLLILNQILSVEEYQRLYVSVPVPQMI